MEVEFYKKGIWQVVVLQINRYNAASIIKNTCIKDSALGYIIQILNLAVTTKNIWNGNESRMLLI